MFIWRAHGKPLQRSERSGTIDFSSFTPAWPALGILVVSVLWMFLGAMGIVYFVSQILDPEMTAADRQIPITYSLYILISVLYSGMLASGAVSMMRRNSYLWATATAILAMVPLLGPCYILGIPFGIWASSVLRDPDVRISFSNP